ncbi:MAG: hypothetical protein JWP44_4989 [Mucilaginibacter sp.]|nr:hypothetical protein [Mucilaginibacter sp.]
MGAGSCSYALGCSNDILVYEETTTSNTTTDKNGNKVTKVVSEEVVISGNSLNGLQYTGKPLRDDPADILAHELVGHAIPHATKSDTGNAVDNENKVRAQEGAGKNAQRAKEPTHVE